MMRKLFYGAVVCLLSIAVPAAVCSAADMYFSGKAGLAMLDDSDFKPYEAMLIDYETEDGNQATLEGDSASFEIDEGPAIAFAIGGAVSDRIRIETEVGYQENDLDKSVVSGESSLNGDTTESFDARGDISSLSILLNGYYDFANATRFTPFLTMGMGLARVEASNLKVGEKFQEGDSDSAFAYQFGAGVAWNLDENIALDLTYRYFATNDPSFDFGDVEYVSDNFYVGLRTKF